MLDTTATSLVSCLPTVPGCVMVAPQILALLVGVRVLPGKLRDAPFVYRLGRKILSLQRGVRFP